MIDVDQQLKRENRQITILEVTIALQMAKNDKATGPDEISMELLKLLGGNGIRAVKEPFNIIFLRVIHGRIYNKLDDKIGNT